jgi:hypothetical protein
LSIFYECYQLVGDDFSSGFINVFFSILLYKDKQGIKLRPEDSIFLGCYAVTNSKHSESFQKIVVAAFQGPGNPWVTPLGLLNHEGEEAAPEKSLF